jgi:hypothetical protein
MFELRSSLAADRIIYVSVTSDSYERRLARFGSRRTVRHVSALREQPAEA